MFALIIIREYEDSWSFHHSMYFSVAISSTIGWGEPYDPAPGAIYGIVLFSFLSIPIFLVSKNRILLKTLGRNVQFKMSRTQFIVLLGVIEVKKYSHNFENSDFDPKSVFGTTQNTIRFRNNSKFQTTSAFQRRLIFVLFLWDNYCNN